MLRRRSRSKSIPVMDEEVPMCWCGKVATIRTSWKYSNPGRRFSMCAVKAHEGKKGCWNKLDKSVAKARQREKVVWVLLVASWVMFASFILGGMLRSRVNNKRSFKLASAIE
ncbi:unnamed protein product [Prunus armeniaca]|uniref:Uncharacterized protein n=1 Tax=Prunus armeniaca TaxID=36596 RepID=A0A6J5WWT6_PRUAR|nr:unnamed protein product [Prunus armeniaca]